MTTPATEHIESRSIAEFAEQAYLNYAMYVIMDRALPHIADGLKPVQRRIVFAMSELGLRSINKPKKSARTVGDVLGKYHPHGDSACYEAMVLMAQPFSYRHPLVEGQGNWGSPDDPKSFAAMRYTEAKLSSYSDLLLSELAQGTSEWQDNFDGSLQEPITLPARLPNILLNGTTGIAVGMATDIPSHNLREVVNGAIALLKNPSLSHQQLCDYIPGPDLPTQAEIISSPDELLKLQETGRGSYRMRAVYKLEKGNIVITALPYQVSGAKVIGQIAEQMLAKKLPFISDIRDESDHEHPTRLVLIPRSGRVDMDSVMGHLFATTELETSYRINMNMIGLDGKPQVKSLHTILSEWLGFRQDTLRKRITFHLEKIEKRLHILGGLLIAYLNIDEVIAIIRSEDQPKPVLIARFNLSDTQAEAILDLKLRHLARLEEMEIRQEQDDLAAKQQALQEQLNNPASLKKLLVKELQDDAKKYGNDRVSPIVARSAAAELKETDMLPAETLTVILSQMGWIRAAKGTDINPQTLTYRAGDAFLASTVGKSNRKVYLLDSTGRSYALPMHTLASARGQGDPATSKLKPPAGAKFTQLIAGEDQQGIVVASSLGYGFVSNLGNLDTNMTAGKAFVSIEPNTPILPLQAVNPNDSHIALLSSGGRLLVYLISELPQLAKGKGNKLMQLSADEVLLAALSLGTTAELVISAGNRTMTLKSKDIAHYHGKRGQRGHLLPRGYQNTPSMLIKPVELALTPTNDDKPAS